MVTTTAFRASDNFNNRRLMNMTPILEQLFTVYWWLLPAPLTISFLKSAFMKGILGELQINLDAKFLLKKNKYTLFKMSLYRLKTEPPK